MVKVETRVRNLTEGLARFFQTRFPTEKYRVSHSLGEEGYYMIYLGADYSMTFYYSGNINFRMSASLKEKEDGLEQRLEENRVSNQRLKKTKYLRDQQIDSNGKTVFVSCIVKKVPRSEADVNACCEQLWGHVIKNVMKSIHTKL